MKKIIILAILSLMGQTSWAQIREFQTARLMSTAGAGVASILSTEAAVLNPASSAFFQGSSFTYQAYNTKLQRSHEDRSSSNDEFPNSNRSQGVFMADHSGPVKGGVAYISQNENNFKRDHVVMHGAAPIGPTTAIGVSYSYITDKLPRRYPDRNKLHHRASIGMAHIIDQKTIIGLVVLDPTRTTPNEERVITGFQYQLADRVTLIADAGAQYTKDVMKEYLWRGAIQINLFSDFFFRVGQFYDNIHHLKGTGWGASWIGPRFGVEFSQRNSEQFDSGYLYRDEKLLDTSLSAIIKF